MKRWLTVSRTLEFEGLERALTSGANLDKTVPALRGWADAVLAVAPADQYAVDPTSRIGAHILTPCVSGPESVQVLVDAQECTVATRHGLAPLIHPIEWRRAKLDLADAGWPVGELEELISPMSSNGASGEVDPRSVYDWVASLRSELLIDLVRQFEETISRYASSWLPLSDISSDRLLDKEVVLSVAAVEKIVVESASD